MKLGFPAFLKKPGERIFFILFIILFGYRAWVIYEEGHAAYLQIAMHSSLPGVTTVYYDTGARLSETECSSVYIREGQMDQDYRFRLPQASIQSLRFDPLTGPGRVSVSRLSIVDGYGNLLHPFDLSSLKPAKQIAEFGIREGRVTMVMEDQANDPQVNILLPAVIPLDQARPFPVRDFRIRLLMNGAGIGLAGFLLFWGYRRYRGTAAGMLGKIGRTVSKFSWRRRIEVASLCLLGASISALVFMHFCDVGPFAYLIAEVILIWSAGLGVILFICELAFGGKRADVLALNLLVLTLIVVVMVPASELVVRLALKNISTTADNGSYFARRWNKTHVRQNSYGYREEEFDSQKAPGMFRIVVIGDSLTFGQGIEEEERFSNRLNRVLKSSGFEFINFGRCGAETVDELQTLRSQALRVKPDFVLLQWYINDVEGGDKSSRPRAKPLWNHWAGTIFMRTPPCIT